ncbi:hypothetical protein [Methylacidiphilum caldifontis]|uniref:hypothetical protein n=1 Tax=Methylacidiphilum caldifontis TaxID=2795386 RepID=UPI00106C1221|nr:hypothetical protein [Methylacidiphilum caldifontis]
MASVKGNKVVIHKKVRTIYRLLRGYLAGVAHAQIGSSPDLWMWEHIQREGSGICIVEIPKNYRLFLE